MEVNDNTTYRKFGLPWSRARTTFGRQKWSGVGGKEDYSGRRHYIVLPACRHEALYSALYLRMRRQRQV